ncbi:hypothetical protein MMC07_007103 [Pseudocyphellaria aurata]|nr:hypothetical protein [Pseudocyphellaria aurata]
MDLFTSRRKDHSTTVGASSAGDPVQNASQSVHQTLDRSAANSTSSQQLESSFTNALFPGPARGSSGVSRPPEEPSYRTEYQPPRGPPPHKNEYAALQGLPTQQNEHAPILQQIAGQVEYAPPDGPPPRNNQVLEEPPPYHDWTVVPDNSLLPPPPSLGYKQSPNNNATLIDADRAHDWCDRNPLIIPHQPTPAQHASAINGDVTLVLPREYHGDLTRVRMGIWKGSTRAGSNDSCLISSLPLYFAHLDSPFKTQLSKTIYFEVKIHSLGSKHRSADGSVALGFCAVPYPTWRLPGWERGSLAVHGDDGRRYVNDTWGGKDFTSAFRVGDTVGLGISFSCPDFPPEYSESTPVNVALKAEVFFTKNGRLEGGWNVMEQLDANDLGTHGLDGNFDLYAACGSFGQVDFECIFTRRDWLWLPR